jgi:copper oxidase (laccase) domain-containing protein
MATPVYERVTIDRDMVAWQSPALDELGPNGIGEVPTGEDGSKQWEFGTRSNLKPENYPGQGELIETLNKRGCQNAEHWAIKMGLGAVARPVRSTGDGGLAHVHGDEFERSAGGLLVANTPEPADFVMLTSLDTPEGAGVMYGVADSHTVQVAHRGGEAVGVIHGIRNAVTKNIGGRAIEFMSEEASIDPAELVAVIGPGLQACCHEVGMQSYGAALPKAATEVRGAIDEGYVPEEALLADFDRPTGETRYRFDARRALQDQLIRAGVGEVLLTSECTAQLLKGGHLPDSECRFPSLRRADERSQDTVIVNGEIFTPARADKVTRYPVVVGLGS